MMKISSQLFHYYFGVSLPSCWDYKKKRLQIIANDYEKQGARLQYHILKSHAPEIYRSDRWMYGFMKSV